jgi:dihydropteroate synthase
MFWQCGRYRFILKPQQPLVMGILNITPDSFFDGGKHTELDQILRHANTMIESGADIIDLGAESSRPGATPVSEEDEMARLKPILAALIPITESANIAVSLDTYKPAVMQMALDSGVSILNDITGFTHPKAQKIARDSQAGLVIMHMKGQPQHMQQNPHYQNVNQEVWSFLLQQKNQLTQQGIEANRMVLDPGIGFGKTTQHNIELLQQLNQYSQQNPTLIGLSRKRFLGEFGYTPQNETRLPPEKRLSASITANLFATLQGAHVLRVHDVFETTQSLDIWQRLAR